MRGSTEAFDLRAALQNELQAAQAALDLQDRATAVHRCRVAVKRARALARLGVVGAPGLSAIFNDAARTTMSVLSAARDLAALGDCAHQAARNAGPAAKRALERAAAALKAERHALQPPDLDDVQVRLRDLSALARAWPEPSAIQLRKGAKRIIRRARRAFLRARGHKRAELRHRWRKREKDRLYIAILVDGAWPKTVERHVKRAQRLAHALGQERDLLLLLDRLTTTPRIVGGKKSQKRARRALKARLRKRAAKADRLGARLHRKQA